MVKQLFKARSADIIISAPKGFGARMMAARELCGLSQLEAYPLFGYQNSSRLAKIELGVDVERVSVPFVGAASRAYDVSVEFLLSLSDHPSRNPAEVTESRVQKILTDLMAGEEERIRSIAVALDKIAAQVERNETRTKELLDAINRFRELNPEFEDMPGGAKLDRLIFESRQDAKRGTEELAGLRKSLKQIS
ncbi:MULTISPECIES: hypothetical protein [Methylomonas]|uniref:Uncharacterized protein n=2 Tax=Methylomonas TaxID=416 RepID=A0A140E5F4_9GAMM|nr:MULTISPECIES: hypothetical protein [Methylomonas]AMK75386.1 hypothetical protein JT25_002595 [Methylomonas denitrificans]AMK75628.1 hypothetical protein JT25_003855 [Methylomonas denitrificans]OAI06257.1 hypothetical protein A1342_22445 [Methylomonas methanica]TCV71019.1 hypothetical protein EDE11_1651 [Methylomonas methanica]